MPQLLLLGGIYRSSSVIPFGEARATVVTRCSFDLSVLRFVPFVGLRMLKSCSR